MHLGADIDFGIKRIKPPGSQLSAKNIARLYAELAGHPLHDSSLPEASTLLSLLCSASSYPPPPPAPSFFLFADMLHIPCPVYNIRVLFPVLCLPCQQPSSYWWVDVPFTIHLDVLVPSSCASPGTQQDPCCIAGSI